MGVTIWVSPDELLASYWAASPLLSALRDLLRHKIFTTPTSRMRRDRLLDLNFTISPAVAGLGKQPTSHPNRQPVASATTTACRTPLTTAVCG